MFPLRIEDLRFSPGGRPVLKGVHLRLEGEGITMVLGPNGAGKSVLLRMLCGLLPPDGGRIVWGAERSSADEHLHGVAMVFQQPMMLRASVQANVELGLRTARLGRAERQQRARRVLERIGLADRAADSARHLSGGEKQRLALGRAWLMRPRLLLLDEPTASLDPGGVEAVEHIVREIRTEGTRILMITHSLGQAARLADDIVFLHDGRVEAHASVQRFFSRPSSDAVRRFIQGELPWHMPF